MTQQNLSDKLFKPREEMFVFMKILHICAETEPKENDNNLYQTPFKL